MEAENSGVSQSEVVSKIVRYIKLRIAADSDLEGDKLKHLINDVWKIAEEVREPKGQERRVAVAVGLALALCKNPSLTDKSSNDYWVKLHSFLLRPREGAGGNIEPVPVNLLQVPVNLLIEGILNLEGYDAMESYLPKMAMVAGGEGGRQHGLKAVDPHGFFGCFHRFAPPHLVPTAARPPFLRAMAKALQSSTKAQKKPGFLNWLCEWTIALEIGLQGMESGRDLDEECREGLNRLKASLGALDDKYRWKAELVSAVVARFESPAKEPASIGAGGIAPAPVGPAKVGPTPEATYLPKPQNSLPIREIDRTVVDIAAVARFESPAKEPASVGAGDIAPAPVGPAKVGPTPEPTFLPKPQNSLPIREIDRTVLDFVGNELRFHLLAIAEHVKNQKRVSEDQLTKLKDIQIQLEAKNSELHNANSERGRFDRESKDLRSQLEIKSNKINELSREIYEAKGVIEKMSLQVGALREDLGKSEESTKRASKLLEEEIVNSAAEIRQAERRGRDEVVGNLRSLLESDMQGLGHQVEKLPDSVHHVKMFWGIFSKKVQTFLRDHQG